MKLLRSEQQKETGGFHSVLALRGLNVCCCFVTPFCMLSTADVL